MWCLRRFVFLFDDLRKRDGEVLQKNGFRTQYVAQRHVSVPAHEREQLDLLRAHALHRFLEK